MQRLPERISFAETAAEFCGDAVWEQLLATPSEGAPSCQRCEFSETTLAPAVIVCAVRFSCGASAAPSAEQDRLASVQERRGCLPQRTRRVPLRLVRVIRVRSADPRRSAVARWCIQERAVAREASGRRSHRARGMLCSARRYIGPRRRLQTSTVYDVVHGT